MLINQIYNGNCGKVLRTFPPQIVQTCVTSPPYYGLRDYGTSVWVGGDPECDHLVRKDLKIASSTLKGSKNTTGHQKEGYKGNCGRCGAERIDDQIGLEATPEEYIDKLVAVFREVKRVLKNDGILWVNIGDSYWRGKGKSGQSYSGEAQDERYQDGRSMNKAYHQIGGKGKSRPTDGKHPEIKSKDLIGIPWMLAFALRKDGWYLRQDIIWSKPNPMPESVRDRCSKSHEYIFMLTKRAIYYFDQKSILKPIAFSTSKDKRLNDENYIAPQIFNGNPGRATRGNGLLKRSSGNKERISAEDRGCPKGTGSNVGSSVPWEGDMANKKSVWTVATRPFTQAYFATFPEELIVDCIRSASKPGDVVLDIFFGAGTTGLVSLKQGRKFVGIDLNPVYTKMADNRLRTEIPMLYVPEELEAKIA